MDAVKRSKDHWGKIKELDGKLSLSSQEEESLTLLRKKIDLVLSTEYQMSKVVPYWGFFPQPGSTYYLQKRTHDVYGIVNEATGTSAVYLFDERTGPKNTDHTISYTTHYISSLPGWIRHVHLFLDNTCSTNKNVYMMDWAWEMVSQDRLDLFRVSFLIAGHTKFSPDLLFFKIAKTYNTSDVFSTTELNDVLAGYADVTVDCGSIVHFWREPVADKYSKLIGIRNLHDFVFSKHLVSGEVVARARALCYDGPFEKSSMHILAGRNPSESIVPDEDQTYVGQNKLRELPDSKTDHLKLIYRDFIPQERWLPFLRS